MTLIEKYESAQARRLAKEREGYAASDRAAFLKAIKEWESGCEKRYGWANVPNDYNETPEYFAAMKMAAPIAGAIAEATFLLLKEERAAYIAAKPEYEARKKEEEEKSSEKEGDDDNLIFSIFVASIFERRRLKQRKEQQK